MVAHALHDHQDEHPEVDRMAVLRGVTWSDYQRLLEIRGDGSVPRFTYLEGTVEIMTPSQPHERLKSLIGQLVEVYCLERGIEFATYGSWTLEDKEVERGIEPDECYVFGADPSSPRPDLAIEVVWTSGLVDELDVYRRLGVREVWVWRKGRIAIHLLRGDGYQPSSASEALPGLDLDLLTSFLDRPKNSEAMRAYRAALTGHEGDRR